MRVDGLGGSVEPTAARDWRLDRALEACLSRPRLSGTELQVVVGHLTVRALIHRGLMSLLRHCYVFIDECYDKRTRLWPGVVQELRWYRAIMPLATANIFSPWNRAVFSTGVCLTGYAVCSANPKMEEARSGASGAKRKGGDFIVVKVRGSHPGQRHLTHHKFSTRWAQFVHLMLGNRRRS